ncbi:MAG: hypothetical protein KDC34_19100 [Saprospiraceae bacterium]|nr:hypothetical protein [Saprospiraceae bacterium]
MKSTKSKANALFTAHALHTYASKPAKEGWTTVRYLKNVNVKNDTFQVSQEVNIPDDLIDELKECPIITWLNYKGQLWLWGVGKEMHPYGVKLSIGMSMMRRMSILRKWNKFVKELPVIA